MSIKALYKQRFYIYRPTITVGEYGNTVETLDLFKGPLKCYCTYLGGGKQVFAGKMNVIASHRLFCDPIKDIIKTNDRIYVYEYDIFFNILYVDHCITMLHHYEN